MKKELCKAGQSSPIYANSDLGLFCKVMLMNKRIHLFCHPMVCISFLSKVLSARFAFWDWTAPFNTHIWKAEIIYTVASPSVLSFIRS